MKKLTWNVIYYDVNSRKIRTFNIFLHGGLESDLKNHFRKYQTKEEFAEQLRKSLFYYFGARAEYEILISPWAGGSEEDTIKVDIYWQIMNNWDRFLDYVWEAGR